MNKYVLIPHDQYESFKKNLAENKEVTITQSKKETVDESKSENLKGDFLNVKSEEKFECLRNKIKNSNNSDKSEKIISVNTPNSPDSTQLSVISYPKAHETF